MIKTNINVCIVCNGESVLQERLGNIVNKMDLVIRIGNFKITSYEEYVGTKTDVILNRKTQTPELTYVTNATQFWSPPPIKTEQVLHSLCLTQEEIAEVCSATKTNSPTTGCAAYFLVRKFVPNIKFLYFHGLDFLNGGHYWNPKHSHELCHEPLKERIWFNRLFLNGKARRLTIDC